MVDPRDVAGFADVLRRAAGNSAGVRARSVAAFGNTPSIALSPDIWVDRLEAVYRERLEISRQKDSPVA